MVGVAENNSFGVHSSSGSRSESCADLQVRILFFAVSCEDVRRQAHSVAPVDGGLRVSPRVVPALGFRVSQTPVSLPSRSPGSARWSSTEISSSLGFPVGGVQLCSLARSASPVVFGVVLSTVAAVSKCPAFHQWFVSCCSPVSSSQQSQLCPSIPSSTSGSCPAVLRMGVGRRRASAVGCVPRSNHSCRAGHQFRCRLRPSKRLSSRDGFEPSFRYCSAPQRPRVVGKFGDSFEGCSGVVRTAALKSRQPVWVWL